MFCGIDSEQAATAVVEWVERGIYFNGIWNENKIVERNKNCISESFWLDLLLRSPGGWGWRKPRWNFAISIESTIHRKSGFAPSNFISIFFAFPAHKIVIPHQWCNSYARKASTFRFKCNFMFFYAFLAYFVHWHHVISEQLLIWLVVCSTALAIFPASHNLFPINHQNQILQFKTYL